MRKTDFLQITGLIMISLGLWSCATPRSITNPRMGLLDQIADLERRGGRSFSVDRPRDIRLDSIRQTTRHWQWPLRKVTINSQFGERGNRFHEGIDLKAKVGTLVKAAHGGKVVYRGSGISGYGKLVVIKHEPSGLFTVYAHNSRYYVQKGQNVKQGQKIALSGRTGRVTGPHLHFEIRKGTVAVNPLQVMPGVSYKRNIASGK